LSEGKPRGWLSIVLKASRYKGGRVGLMQLACRRADKTARSGVRSVLFENPASSVSIVATLRAGRQRNLRLSNENNVLFPKRIERMWRPNHPSIVGYLLGLCPREYKGKGS